MAHNAISQDELIAKHSSFTTIKRILSYLKPYRLRVAVIIMLMLIVMACNVLIPYMLQVSIDTYVSSKNVQGLIKFGGLLLLISFVSMVVSKYRLLWMNELANKILINIRHELYTHIQTLSFSFFDNRPVGKILARVVGDVSSLQNLLNTCVTNTIPDLFTLVFVMIMMFSMNPKLAVCSIIIIPVLMISMFTIEIKATKLWADSRQKRSNFIAYSHEAFSGIKVTEGFNKEDFKAKGFYKSVSDHVNAFDTAVKVQDLFWPTVDISQGIGTVIVFLAGYFLVKNGSLSSGTLIAFTMYIGMLWRPIINLSDFYTTLISNFSAAERIFDILDINPDIKSDTNALIMPEIKGNIRFKNVDFFYDKETQALSNINFEIKAGQKIAFVGETGAGKSTIASLISRFYDPQKGQILIDGIDIKHVDIESLRSQMGIMLQDTFLFSSSIKENIRYGKLDATDDEIIAAAKAVNAHDFIMSLEDGYETNVNERGSRLSLGQRQLISFARALLANPKILILDEATSNIDTHTERLVQKGIQKLLTGRTSIVIAHRLSTIRDCDKIMVVSDGKIIECGTHEQLLRQKGAYYDLYMAQYSFLSA